MTRKGYGESTGKIILIGEHAVTFAERPLQYRLTAVCFNRSLRERELFVY